MNRFALMLLIIIALASTLPTISLAFNNQIEASVQSGSGEYDSSSGSAELSMGEFGVLYSRYFDDLESTDSPYAMREYLQHPTKLYFSLSSLGEDLKANGYPYTIEKSQGDFSLGGIYYFQNGSGIGGLITLSSGDGETNDNSTVTSNDEYSDLDITLTANHYINDTIRIGADLTSSTFNNENSDLDGNSTSVENADQTIKFRASSLIKNIYWVSGKLGFGNRSQTNTDVYDTGVEESYDLSSVAVEAGMFPIQEAGIFLGYSSETVAGDTSEQEEAITSLSGKYNINESIQVTASFLKIKRENRTNGTKLNESEIAALRLDIEMLF